MLALGAALCVGNVAALIRPPDQPREPGDLEAAPRGRSLLMAAAGAIAAVWALASLFSG
jgi:hypothetical protein